MAIDYSKLTDAEVYERCAKALNLFPLYDETHPQVAEFARRRVLDAMAERGFGYQIRKYSKTSDITEVGVLFRLGPGVWDCEHDSLDRAICVAALLALEAEDE